MGSLGVTLTAGLDPILTTIVNRLMKTTIDGQHSAVLTIIQYVFSALQIADRIAMLHKGRIAWEGPVADIHRSGNDHADAYIANSRKPPSA